MEIEPGTYPTCVVEKAGFRGWQAIYLRNGLVNLAAVPDIGGRVMAFDLGPYPFFFVDPNLAGRLFTPEENQGDGSLAAWKNYGGDKTWPAPQGWDTAEQWHGPPDPVLDTGRYTVVELLAQETGATLCMVSPPDARTGLQISRRVGLLPASSRVNLELTFTNISDRVVRWSIWDVIQFRAERTLPSGKLAPEPGCSISAPLNPDSRFRQGYNVMFGQADNPQWGVDLDKRLFIARYLWEIGKVGLDSPGDWIAFSNAAAGYAFAARYPFFPRADYPDQGATVECWTVGKGKVANLDYAHSDIYLMEAEILSPLITFSPGQAYSFTIQWGACRCPGPVIESNSAGCISRALQAEAVDGYIMLSGAFGVFDLGRLELVWKDGRGEALRTEILGPADPLKMVILDGLFKPPAGAEAVVLQTLAGYDGSRRILAGQVL